MIADDAFRYKIIRLSTVSQFGEDFCAPKQMDGGLNTGFIQTEEVEDVRGTRREKNELVNNGFVFAGKFGLS